MQGEDGVAGGAGSSKSGALGKRFEIKKWNAVAMWSWAICTDTCAICRNNLYEPSIEYQANPNGKAPFFSSVRSTSNTSVQDCLGINVAESHIS